MLTSSWRRSGSKWSKDLIAQVSLYRGELLPGFYDESIGSERDRIQATLLFAKKWITCWSAWYS